MDCLLDVRLELKVYIVVVVVMFIVTIMINIIAFFVMKEQEVTGRSALKPLAPRSLECLASFGLTSSKAQTRRSLSLATKAEALALSDGCVKGARKARLVSPAKYCKRGQGRSSSGY